MNSQVLAERRPGLDRVDAVVEELVALQVRREGELGDDSERDETYDQGL